MAQPKPSSWDFLPAHYDPGAFYIGSKDRNGDRAFVPRLSFPALLHEEIKVILATRRFPAFRTEEDLLRHCLTVGLHDLNDRAPDERLETELDIHHWQQEHERRRLLMEGKRQTVEAAEEILGEWADTDATVRAEELVDVAAMVESGHYQGELRQRLEALLQRYGAQGPRLVQ